MKFVRTSFSNFLMVKYINITLFLKFSFIRLKSKKYSQKITDDFIKP